MPGFEDLVEKAQPTLGRYPAKATAGSTWRFIASGPDFQDADGVPVDLRGTTGECAVVDEDGAEVITLGYAGRVGEVLVFNNDEVKTASVADGAERRCRWSLRVTNGTDAVQVWAVNESPFIIRRR